MLQNTAAEDMKDFFLISGTSAQLWLIFLQSKWKLRKKVKWSSTKQTMAKIGEKNIVEKLKNSAPK